MRLLPYLLAAGLATVLRAQDAAPAGPADNATPTDITSTGPMETISTDTDSTITFRDHVVVIGNGLKLNCDFLKVIAIRKGDPTATVGQYNSFKSLLATGHVRIEQVGRVATCGKAEVFPGEDRIVLTENPVVVITDDHSTFTGWRMTLYRNKRQALIEPDPAGGTVKAVLPPLKDLGLTQPDQGPASPAKAPAAP